MDAKAEAEQQKVVCMVADSVMAMAYPCRMACMYVALHSCLLLSVNVIARLFD